MNSIIQGIAALLDNEYGYEVYTDEIKQGFESPCFFIEAAASRYGGINKSRYKTQVFISIYFYPKEQKDVNSQMLKMAEGLYALLEVFKHEDRSYRSIDMSHSQTQDCLIVDFHINCHTYKNEDIPQMEELKLEAGTRGWN